MQKADRLNESKIMKNGMKATIIEYRSGRDLDIQFEDGTIVLHRNITNWKRGTIKNPNIAVDKGRLGETKLMTNGQKATITGYRSCMDLDIIFEDGTLKEHTTYDTFKKGNIKNPNYTRKEQLIGQSVIMRNGQSATIVDYYSSENITVQFEDGTVVKKKGLAAFKKGYIKNPNHNRKTVMIGKRVGESKRMKNGLIATIVNYKNAKSIDIQFEDGVVVTNMAYSQYKEGTIAHPLLYKRYKGYKLVIQLPDTPFCVWETEKGYEVLLTIDEINQQEATGLLNP